MISTVPIAIPPQLANPVPLEWSGRFLAVDTERRGNIYELRAGTFTRMEPESPVAGVPVGDYELSYENMSPILQTTDPGGGSLRQKDQPPVRGLLSGGLWSSSYIR